MQHIIDIEILKKEPEMFFMQLSEEAEKEFISLLEYMVYKYKIKINLNQNTKEKTVGGILKAYSNPILIKQEKNIWDQVIKAKYENH